MAPKSVLQKPGKRLAKASCSASCTRLALALFGLIARIIGVGRVMQQDALQDGSQVAFGLFQKTVLLKIINEISGIVSRARRYGAFLLKERVTHMRTHAPAHGAGFLAAKPSNTSSGYVGGKLTGKLYPITARFPAGSFTGDDGRSRCCCCGCLRCRQSRP